MSTNGYRKPLEHADWVRRAASTDQARPVLTGYNVADGSMAATDGYRMHIAPRAANMAEGTWTWAGEAIEGTYPNWRQIVPDGPATLEVVDVDGMTAIAAAAAAARKSWGVDAAASCVSLPAADGGHAYLKPAMLLDALMGAMARYGGPTVELRVESPLKAMRLDVSNGRRAVLMPFRANSGLDSPPPHPRFDLSEFVKAAGS